MAPASPDNPPESVLTGRRLDVYELHELIGAGNMGEVYRATDTTLHRAVAVKVLPKLLRLDVDRVARLQREAQLLAALNHPNIATIHGLQDAGDVLALILELVEGPTLAERLSGGPATVHEAVTWARQIAQGLKAAHERAIVHRDLKPANIKLRPDGVIKLLDFGLAKLQPRDASSLGVAAATTISATGTREAVIVGTLAYMSPEQVRGEDVDERTDIWAFGCVLFVLLSGREPFAGRTSSGIIAAILGQEPDWSGLPAETPAPLRRILRRCLQKDRRSRLRDLGEALADLDEAATPAPAGPQDVPEAGARGQIPSRRLTFAATVAAAIVVAAVLWPRSDDPASVTRFPILPPAGFHLAPAVPGVSPDGRTVVFSACSRCDTEDLDNWIPYRRSLDQLGPVPMPLAQGAFLFFFSPDGRSIGFARRDGVFKVSAAGEQRTTLYEGLVMGADWAPDDTVVFASEAGLMRVSAAGGTPQSLTSPKPGTIQLSPATLPGGRGVLFTEWDGPALTGTGHIAVVSFDGKVERTLLRGSSPRLSPTGHVVFARDRALWAAPFDERSLTVSGEVVPVAEMPAMLPSLGEAIFTIGRNGTFAYVTGVQPKAPARTLAWVARGKGEERLNLPPAAYGWPRVAPDGRQIALDIVGEHDVSDIWTYDIAGGRLSKLTDDPQINLGPVWTRDGKEVVYTTGPPFAFFSKPLASGAPAHHLVSAKVPGGLAAGNWSPDGKSLVFTYLSQARLGEHPPFDIGLFTADGGKWSPLLQSEAAEVNPVISPAGDWIAYSSNQTGRFEVYIERFPELGARQMASKDGGIEPIWAPNGKEIFYRSVDGLKMLSVAFDPQSGVHGDPATVFEGRYASYLGGLPFRSYDVMPDGKRFIMIKEQSQPGEPAGTLQMNVVLNWSRDLKRR